MTSDRTGVEYLVEELARLTDAVKALGAFAQQPVEPLSSVEIARTIRGATWTVRVYDRNPAGASELAQALYDELAARYGQPEASA
jgi:hypothetical protein